MKNPTIKALSLLSFLSIAILLATASLITNTAHAHDVIDANGKPTHSHVYKKAANGNGVIVGHAAKPAGSHGIVIWQSAPNQSYKNAQTGMSIPRDPWSKKKQNPRKKKPAFTKNQSRKPVLKPQ